MYAFVDRPLASLDEGCRFLVWSMRAWVSSLPHRRCPAQVLAPAFARWRMIGGLQAFHRAMLLLNRDALEHLHFAPLCCPTVSEHEAVLLALVAGTGAHPASLRRDTLALMVSEDGIGDLLGCLEDLGAAMAVAGMLPTASAL